MAQNAKATVTFSQSAAEEPRAARASTAQITRSGSKYPSEYAKCGRTPAAPSSVSPSTRLVFELSRDFLMTSMSAMTKAASVPSETA